MRVLTVRNVPDDLYRALAARAERNRRSLQQEVLALLDRARALERGDALERARQIRERLAGRELGDTVQEVRRERQR